MHSGATQLLVTNRPALRSSTTELPLGAYSERSKFDRQGWLTAEPAPNLVTVTSTDPRPAPAQESLCIHSIPQESQSPGSHQEPQVTAMGSSRGSTPIHHSQHSTTTRTALGRGYHSTTPQISPIWWFFPGTRTTATHQPAQGNRKQQNPLAGVSPSHFPEHSTAMPPCWCQSPASQEHSTTQEPASPVHSHTGTNPSSRATPWSVHQAKSITAPRSESLSAQHCLTQHARAVRLHSTQVTGHDGQCGAQHGAASPRAVRGHTRRMVPNVMCHVARNRHHVTPSLTRATT